jgi:hypothetical protein
LDALPPSGWAAAMWMGCIDPEGLSRLWWAMSIGCSPSDMFEPIGQSQWEEVSAGVAVLQLGSAIKS